MSFNRPSWNPANQFTYTLMGFRNNDVSYVTRWTASESATSSWSGSQSVVSLQLCMTIMAGRKWGRKASWTKNYRYKPRDRSTLRTPNGGSRQNAVSLSVNIRLVVWSRTCHWTTSDNKHFDGVSRIDEDRAMLILWNMPPATFPRMVAIRV